MGNCIKTKSSKNASSKGVTKSNKSVLCKEETDKGIFILGLFVPSRDLSRDDCTEEFIKRI